MRIADRVAEILIENNFKDLFMVTGGMAMHLNDALTRSGQLKTTFFHHEQACTMAAEGYSRQTGKDSLVCVTAGPGAVNALNGVFGAYNDSIPMFVISGQVRTDTLNKSKSLRQLGDQEAPIVDMVKKITKYSKLLDKKDEIDYEVYKAIEIMRNGRKGPVWLDIPINIQGEQYIKSEQKKFIIKKEKPKNINSQAKLLSEALSTSKRPLLMVGGGLRTSGAQKDLQKFIDNHNIPVVSAYNGHDLFWESNKKYIGRCGTQGDRRGNLAVECSDLIIALGTSLNIRQIGYNYNDFASEKYLCYIDIDSDELKKKTIKKNVDLPINSDIKYFLSKYNEKYSNNSSVHKEFLKWSLNIKNKYSTAKEKYPPSKKINPYKFVIKLSKYLKSNDTIVTSNAMSAVAPMVAMPLKKGQRFFGSSGSGSMGYGLPSSIGAALGDSKRRVLCFEGDGSIQMNIQELATVRANNLNILIFVFANNGYHSIRQTQTNYFKDNLVGIDVKTGLSFPELNHIAKAYKIPYKKITKANYIKFLAGLNELKLPLIVEVELDEKLPYQPRVKSRTDENGNIVSAKLYDMHPYLDKKEMEAVLRIKKN
jgi:acetolactate synthase-1/2/3 large subunit